MSRRNNQTSRNAQPDLFATQLETSVSAATGRGSVGADAAPLPPEAEWPEPLPPRRAYSQTDAAALTATARPHLLDVRAAAAWLGLSAVVVRQPAQVREAETRPGHLLDVRAAAAWLGLSKSTLDKMRCYGVGPTIHSCDGKGGSLRPGRSGRVRRGQAATAHHRRPASLTDLARAYPRFASKACRFSGRAACSASASSSSSCPVTSGTCSIARPASNSRLVHS